MIRPTIRPLPAGSGRPQATATLAGSSDAGRTVALTSHYTEAEYLVAGVGRSYSGPVTGPVAAESPEQPFVTRILVRCPADPSRFSGRVVVEPFNTSGGPDVDAIWSRVGEVLVAAGDAWVGISHRTSSETTMKHSDPVRYQAVSIPSNDLAWDMIAQVGAVVRDSVDGPLAPRRVRQLYLAGYSQSGSDTATFAMAFHARAVLDDGSPVFDGYFPAAHSGSLTQLRSGQRKLPAFETAPMHAVGVPVVDIEMQTDVEGFRVQLSDGRIYTSPGGASVRRDDGDQHHDRFRLYEVAGAPHAASCRGCDGTISTFPAAAFLRAALVRLFRWTEDGTPPPVAQRLALSELDVVSVAAVDQVGNALGGVRSPHLDVPLARYDAHSTPGARCVLAGRQTLLSPETLSARYGTPAAHLASFTRSLDETIAAGYLLEADRSDLLAAQESLALEAFAAPATRLRRA